MKSMTREEIALRVFVNYRNLNYLIHYRDNLHLEVLVLSA